MLQPVDIRAIVPREDKGMARRRYQHGNVFQTKAKDKSARRWFFRARIDALVGPGQTKRVDDRIYLGSVSEMTKREAEKKRDDTLAQSINKPEVMLSSQVKFGVVMDKWLAITDVTDSSNRSYRSIVKKHLRPQWGDVMMCDITPIAVQEWLIAKAKACTKLTLKAIKLRFSQVWKCAIFCRFTREANPTIGMPSITRFGVPARAATLPTREQFHEFLYMLDEPYRSIVIVCALTGMRIGEVLALTTAQLNSESAFITEQVEQYKNRIIKLKTRESERTIPMAHLRQDIVVPMDADPDERPYNVGYGLVKTNIKEAARAVKIDYRGFGCHTFRRMHNTMFRLQAGKSETVVKLAMRQLGHSESKTNDLYFNPDGAEDVRQRSVVASDVRRNVMETVN